VSHGIEELKILFVCLGLCFAQSAVADSQLSLISSLAWSEDNENHGGYSGLHVDNYGETFIAVTDKGSLVTGQFLREDEHLIGFKNTHFTFLRPVARNQNLDAKGRPTDFNSDAEGLSVGSDGTLFVSFESHHRIRRYASINSPAKGVKKHAEFAGFQPNSGMESLAIDAQDRLYTLPERSGKWTRPFQVYRLSGNTWDKWAKLPRRDRFLPTGADIGPDGKFYLLERRFEYFQGFASRVRRFDMSETGLENEQILLSSPFRVYGNTEGISVWQNAEGQLRITLLTDDNFNFLQSTQFHEFKIID